MPLNTRTRKVILGIVVLVGAGLAGWWVMGVYTVRTYQPFLAPARAFITAGLAQDSAGLARLGAEPAAVRWALDTGRHDAAFLRTLDSGLYVGYGMRRGDSTLVLFGVRTLGQCSRWPLTILFAGPPGAARIHAVSGGCEPPGRKPPAGTLPV